ncbi:MAG: MarR family winged helix-turn-helix transcriptional regulator [Sulfitobacter sp.]
MAHKNDDKKLIATVVLLERFVRDIYPTKHSSAIQPLQWSILRYLDRMPADRCEVRWIAQFLGLTRAPVTRAVATLERHDYVRCATNGQDARTKTIALTPHGINTLSKDPILKAVEHIRALPKDEQTQFINTIRSIALNSGSSRDDGS